ncbi:hypothetical protein ACN9JG_00840 [Cereibacter azotoformans]|uniref:hypothetical protein n=1 Tax=Cereibacter azotoformans TaxID=43057 RepID=UPI003B20D519
MPLGLQLRLSLLFTAFLYLGPLFAGVGRHPWPVVPAFVALFLLWTMVVRPAQWPRDRAGWRGPGVVVRVAATAAMQTFLVVLLHAIGRGIGSFLPDVTIPLSLPLALALVSIPLSRLALDPERLAFARGDLEEVPEELAVELEGQRADRLVAPFLRLPDDTGEVELMRRLVALAPSLTSAALLDALDRGIEAADGPARAARRALILQATSVATADTCQGRAEPMRALRVAADDRGLLHLLTLRLRDLLEQRPQAEGDCPSIPDLRAAASRATVLDRIGRRRAA